MTRLRKSGTVLKILLAVLLLAYPTMISSQDRHLDEWYTAYNHMYFQDELPKTVVITRNLQDDRFMAITDYSDGLYHIGINPRYNLSTKTERINLLHEQCHILGFVEHDDEFDQHGPKWQACMLRIAKSGGFNDLW